MVDLLSSVARQNINNLGLPGSLKLPKCSETI